MKRRIFCLFLSILIFGLAGCRNAAPPESPLEITPPNSGIAEVQPTEPEPAAIPEELVPLRDLGIAEEAFLVRPNDTATRNEIIALIAAVHDLRYGSKSAYLSELHDMETNENTAAEPATRYYFAQALYFSAMETVHNEPYTTLGTWQHYCNEHDPGFAWPDAQVITMRLDGKTGEGGVWDHCPDLKEIENPANADSLRWGVDFGISPAVNYAMLAYDRTDGRKVLELDEDRFFRPHEAMSVEEAALAALRYYNFFEEEAEMISYGETRTYDAAIITSELLARETSLPDAGCDHLPAEWHGVLMFDMGRVTHQALGGMPDKHIYEYEIQAVKDAGFNFIGLAFDFSILQGPSPEAGMLNETRLKQLDQVIAWCMERDIHVDLRCSSPGGKTFETSFPEWVQYNHDVVQTADYAPEFAALWKALAQRYTDIPNCYLSFNLMIEPEIGSDDQYVAFFGPAVEAIREVSPDRCIILDIHSGGLKADKIIGLGTALSYHCYDPRSFCAIPQELENDPDYLSSAVWPYTDETGKAWTAADVLDARIHDSISANELAKIAADNGLGFMVGEFGIFGTIPSGYRYPMTTMEAYYTDMAQAMAEKDYGWCCGVWDGAHGAAASWPTVFDASYTRIGEYPYFIDDAMAELFRSIAALN